MIAMFRRLAALIFGTASEHEQMDAEIRDPDETSKGPTTSEDPSVSKCEDETPMVPLSAPSEVPPSTPSGMPPPPTVAYRPSPPAPTEDKWVLVLPAEGPASTGVEIEDEAMAVDPPPAGADCGGLLVEVIESNFESHTQPMPEESDVLCLNNGAVTQKEDLTLRSLPTARPPLKRTAEALGLVRPANLAPSAMPNEPGSRRAMRRQNLVHETRPGGHKGQRRTRQQMRPIQQPNPRGGGY
uniref:uncharacterized protein isoform X1 n=2 Tax=Myxine glutinosa TaxID=7769 RepID=UPI00358F56A7